jgi:hypothetical protein
MAYGGGVAITRLARESGIVAPGLAQHYSFAVAGLRDPKLVVLTGLDRCRIASSGLINVAGDETARLDATSYVVNAVLINARVVRVAVLASHRHIA